MKRCGSESDVSGSELKRGGEKRSKGIGFWKMMCEFGVRKRGKGILFHIGFINDAFQK